MGQLPVYYNKKNPRGHDYVEMSAAPLYTFGYGRSYTRFEYSQLNVQSTDANRFEVSFQLKNTGVIDGTEVVQLYLRDELASVVQPNKQLKQFQRIALKAGEQRAIRFILDQENLSIIDQNMKPKVEAGEFTVMIGGSSSGLPLKTTFRVQ